MEPKLIVEVNLAPPPKRVKWSKKRYERFNRLRQMIAAQYKHAVDTHEPITKTFTRVHNEFQDADVTATQRKALNDSLWATREFVVLAYSRWQLYLPCTVDGGVVVRSHGINYRPVTSEEVSALREAGDEDVWQRVHGRTEWRDSHMPFYTDAPPHALHSEPHVISTVSV